MESFQKNVLRFKSIFMFGEESYSIETDYCLENNPVPESGVTTLDWGKTSLPGHVLLTE